MNDCESEALTPKPVKGQPESTVQRSGFWGQRSGLEKSLIISLTFSLIVLVTLSLVLTQVFANENQMPVESVHESGTSSPLTSDDVETEILSLKIVSQDEAENDKQTSSHKANPKMIKNSTEFDVNTDVDIPWKHEPKDKTANAKRAKTEKSNQFISSEEEDDVDINHLDNQIKSELQFSGRVDKYLRKKMSLADRKFAERYPRDHAGSSLKQLGQFLPRPLSVVYHGEGNSLSDSEKISEIIHSLDLDGNGSASPWELHDWMLWVEKRVHQHVVEDQWVSLGLTSNYSLGWSDYYSKVHPHGLRDAKSKRRNARERRRWHHADNDGDDKLTKNEFKRFLFPQLSDGPSASGVIVHEAHEALDADYDGRVSQSEFVSVHRNLASQEADEERPEATYFRTHLDHDQSGFLDIEEIAQWVEPTGFIQAKSEVVYLMQHLDTDLDKEISNEEANAKPDLFLSSQVTFFGQLYELKNLRAEVFHLPITNE